MGANVSVAKQVAETTIKNTASNSCTINQSISQEIKGLELHMKKIRCPGFGITIANRASLGGTCDLSAMSTALADASMELSNDQVASLGIGQLNVNSTLQERKTLIENELNNKCSTNQNIKQNIEGHAIYLEDVEGSQCTGINIYNDANAATQCIASAVNKALSSDNFKAKSKQKVDTKLLDLGNLAIAAGVIVFVIVIAVVIIMVSGSKNKGSTTGTRAGAGAEAGAGAGGAFDPNITEIIEGVDGEPYVLGGGGGRKGKTIFQIDGHRIPLIVIFIAFLVWYTKQP